MFRGAQKAIIEASGLSQSFVSLYFSGRRDINNYQTAERLSKAFPGTAPEDWIKRKFAKIERAVAKWACKNWPKDECRKWSNYRFK